MTVMGRTKVPGLPAVSEDLIADQSWQLYRYVNTDMAIPNKIDPL